MHILHYQRHLAHMLFEQALEFLDLLGI